MEQTKKELIQTLRMFCGLYEEVWSKDMEIMEDDNHDDYKAARQRLRQLEVGKDFGEFEGSSNYDGTLHEQNELDKAIGMDWDLFHELGKSLRPSPGFNPNKK